MVNLILSLPCFFFVNLFFSNRRKKQQSQPIKKKAFKKKIKKITWQKYNIFLLNDIRITFAVLEWFSFEEAF